MHQPRLTVNELGENRLVELLAERCAPDAGPDRRPRWLARAGLARGIGDDTALLELPPGREPPREALTADLLLAGNHFLPTHPPRALGRKAAAANLSDLAAAGAWPLWMLVSLALPGETELAWVEELYDGLLDALRPYGARLGGGDLARGEALGVSIAAGGLCPPGVEPPRRAGRPGQTLYATGSLGDSRAGLGLALEPGRARRLESRDADFLLARHREPHARCEAGVALARLLPDLAMMDLSDGLAEDLPRLARASGCAACLRAARLPLSPALRRAAAQLGEPAPVTAYLGGEDFELLFATAQPPERWKEKVARAVPGRPLRITAIGRLVEGEPGAVEMLDAQGSPLDLGEAVPFRHFEG